MGTSKNILVVEDDGDLRTTIVNTLSNAGYQAMGTATLKEAIFKVKNQKFDCILLDIRLGPDNGTDLLSTLHGSPGNPNAATPVIVISGHLDKSLVAQIGREIQGALVKPFAPSDLLARLQKIFPR